MEGIQVRFGPESRTTLAAAFDSARHNVEAAFFSISDRMVLDSLRRAADRGVHVCLHVEGHPERYSLHRGAAERDSGSVDAGARSIEKALRRALGKNVEIHVECDPDAELHAKAAVVDWQRAFILTANANECGFRDPGEVCVADGDPSDVDAVARAVHAGAVPSHSRVVAGPGTELRVTLQGLLNSPGELRVASEDLSDPDVIEGLKTRVHDHHDRVIIKVCDRLTHAQEHALESLEGAGVDVRALPYTHMHEKYVDAGDAIYVGSANLTQNGLDEAREIGIVAPAADFGGAAQTLRDDFDKMWSEAVPAKALVDVQPARHEPSNGGR